MKQRMEWKIATVLVICLVAFTALARAQEADESGKELKGEVRFRYDWLGVNKDKGRFREDNWMTDGHTGGLDWLHLESTGPDRNGYEWLLEARALYDYDYRMSLLMKKEDSHYLKLDFSGLRRYYDGSNRYWDPTLAKYGSRSREFAEMSDGDFFVDRRNYNIELGLTPPEGAQWVFGWHRLEKDGKEVLLRGGRERTTSSDRVLGYWGISNQRRITDTIYGEVAQTFAEKYNFRIRQEFEQHHGDQRIDNADERNGATFTNKDFFYDPGYTNWRTMFMFDSFLDRETYVTANYMYNYLNSNSTFSEYNNGSISESARDTGNSRRTNVGALGYRKANALRVSNLDFTAAVRVEDSKTSSQSDYGYDPFGAPPFRYGNMLRSSLDEVRVAEVFRLVYKGIKRTTLSFDADLEQRDLNWDARGTDYPADIDRKTDTDFLDQVYTFKAVHRHNRAVKSTVKFRIKDLERSMTNLYRAETSPTSFPGILGSYRRRGEDLTLKTDFRFNSKTSSTLMYQYVHEGIDFELGGKTSNQEIHRGLGSLSFSPKQNLFLVGSFMLENYDIDTPATVASTSYGVIPSDFRGNSYSLLLDGTYAFNGKTSATLGFRHTEALGTVDYAGNYVYDSVGLTLNRKIAENKTIGIGYQFYNYNNHDGGDFDDYRAHGVFVTYAFKF
ncbi:MAG: hypothetical protein ACYS83_08060 [Planctomycetota bacterium]|jgi:hypothetical protein